MQQTNLDKPSWMEMFNKAILLHQNGITGDKEAVREGYHLLKQVRNQVPDDNLVIAYYGSILCLIGRDASDPMERSANIIRGFKYLDHAVTSEPANFEIRIIRGNVCVNLPEMYFHRSASAIEDFQFLVSCYERYPDSIPAELYFQFLYNLSLAYGNLGKTEDSERIQAKILDESKDPKYQLILAQKKNGNNLYGDNHFLILLQPLSVILAEGEKLHQRALAGEKKDIKNATDFFAKAEVLHGDNQLLKAYHGDCMSLAGRDASNTGEMFANAIKAIKTIDAAVISDPENVKIRVIRANHSMRLPELFFARTATAIIDLEYLAGRNQQDKELFNKDQSEEILYKLGLCYSRLGLNTEAKGIWKDLLPKVNPVTQTKIEAQLQNNLRLEFPKTLSLETNREGFYTEAKRIHNLGVSGNKSAAQLGLQLWEKAHSYDSDDPLAQGYYGSSLALTGRDATDINGMFGNGIKGLKQLSEALDRDPDNWELRLLRAYLTYSLPEVFFHTAKQAIQDFLYLKKAYERNNKLFAKELYDRILSDLANVSKRIGQC